MTIVACICTKQIKGGAPRAFAASKIIVSKSGCGSRSECCSGSCHCAFLISRITWSNPGQTRIIFKPGLTRTKRDPVDPDDPTRFQRWFPSLCNWRTVAMMGQVCNLLASEGQGNLLTFCSKFVTHGYTMVHKCLCSQQLVFILLLLYSVQHWRSTATCAAALELPNLNFI